MPIVKSVFKTPPRASARVLGGKQGSPNKKCNILKASPKSADHHSAKIKQSGYLCPSMRASARLLAIKATARLRARSQKQELNLYNSNTP
jgi:hypothetical protein